MSTPGEQPQERPASRPGSYGEIAPGVPRYGQYAPEGWQPPQPETRDASGQLPPAASYPGFKGAPQGPDGGLPGPADQHLAPPSKVLLASRLILAAGIMQAVSVVALLVVLFVPTIKASVVDVLRSAFASSPELAAMYSDPTMMDTVLFLAFVLSIAMTACYFWISRNVRKGAGWARTTSLVLAAISLLFLIPPNPVTVVQVLLGIIAVYLMFQAPAAEFFRARKDARDALKR
ncbi:hypothetical protein JOF48_001138 [Arthrobacter stackebrandtii]|uniref:Uncharacterized protein n=1 Tax=Arthrobacter stackebrandtii TaxID=272161 RepID=A0ABS4YUA4_9MICC|nr:hypothetical protein [Arthrobacter stackebrandtii]MBP2412339.1 hypothetical protein [Arthrobacter stackebrandtii]PYH02115.1 hypothetical protein CVV67_01345 [Arthrobacter stackebrandtii]